MRQTHVAGERLFVDYAGTTLDVIDASTGEAMPAQLFVAALGASNYTYAEATWTQGLADWIGSHTRAFAFIGAVPAMVVSDNLKSGVAKACFYEPAVNRTYAEMAAHYDTAIVPARPYKPRDKAKVEVAVQVATRFIIAKLRNRRFFSLVELNVAIAELVAQLNNRMSRHLGASRRALFEERGCGLASQRARSKFSTAVSGHLSHMCARPQTASTRRCASTCPSSHRRYADWTPERLRRQAGEIGRHASALVEIILRERAHPEQGFRACVGILRTTDAHSSHPRSAQSAQARRHGASLRRTRGTRGGR